MKTKIYLLTMFLFVSMYSFGQEWDPILATSTDQIYRSGNVGLGTTTPTEQLELGSGNIELPDGTGTINGNIYLGGNTASGENGMRLFGGDINGGAFEGGMIDVKTDNPNDGLRFRVNTSFGDVQRMIINARGNVGIGTSNPASRLAVNGNGDVRHTAYFKTTSTVNGNIAIFGQADQPTGFSSSSTGVYGQIKSGRGYARGIVGSASSPGPSNKGRAYGVLGSASNATKGANFGVYAQVIGLNSGAAVFAWNRLGYPGGDGHGPTGTVPKDIHYAGYFIGKGYFSHNVGIGVRDPQNELEVCGTIRAKEVKVEASWCDYVFADDYKMPTLQEEAQHINEKGYLLSFESEEVMNGEIKLGDVTKRQQETIEKLMLHLIEMDKKIKELEAKVSK